MNQLTVIDVTKIEPKLKHGTIFQSYDALPEGASLVIHNDHDPKPLYYQLLAERGNTFSWEYLENGPVIWEVEIGKRVAAEKEQTIGEIAAKDIKKAEIFKKYGLDFCCGGRKTLAEACMEKGLDVLKVKEELERPTLSSVPQHDFNSWNLSFLADYIVNVHHGYVRSQLPIIEELSEKVAGHHGATNPELNVIRDKVNEMLSELKAHLRKEEQILFPYIKQMETSSLNGTPLPSVFQTIMEPISVMEHDHDIVGEIAAYIRDISGDYIPPANACNSYSLLYKKLEEFENDLHLHIHLENNILFPKAAELEKKLS